MHLQKDKAQTDLKKVESSLKYDQIQHQNIPHKITNEAHNYKLHYIK